MHIYISIVLFVFGLVIASFLNALLYRIDNGYKYPDIFIKGSHCEKCKKQLTWYELIPVLSYFIFRVNVLNVTTKYQSIILSLSLY
jgi:prepilin signal peptidase PulO-like enzyme (type II secretory pathway)